MEIDDVNEAKATEMLRSCCGASRWIAGMVKRRPFRTPDVALRVANEVWGTLEEKDWIEAFDHHPRIGGTKGTLAQDRRGSFWSEQEQSGAKAAPNDVKSELQQVNENYERRYGFIYIVSATGKTAEEMLADAQSRMHNDKTTELRIAAEEQRKIMELRLKKLLAV